MQKFSDTIATTKPDGTIEVLPSATVTVYLAGTTTPATIYSTNTGTAKTNPFLSAASTGRIEFYAADGRYDLRVDKAGYATVSVLDVLLEDPDNIDDNLDGVTISNSTLSSCILLNATVNDVDSVSFSDTPDALTPRRMAWNVDEGTLDVALDNSTTLQLGQELHYRARNATAATIADGAVVWATGTTGNSGRINIGLAVANNSQPGKTVMGLLTHDTAAGADGYVAAFGKVRGVNTTGATVGETWADGDILYLQPTIPGALTKVKPTVNGHSVVTVALVIHAHSNGTLFVRPTADSQEADEIRYTPASTGAVATTVQSKLRQIVGVLDVGDTDNVGTLTLNVPSEYATIQAAFDYLAGKTIAAGTAVQIKVADGTYTLSSGINANHPQGSQIRLIGNETTPDNCVITVSGAPTFDALVVSNGNELGYLNGFKFNLSSKAGLANNYTAVLANNGAVIICGPNLKTNNWYYGIAARNGSFISCDYATVDNAGDVGIWAYVGSTIYCRNATSTNANDSANGFGYGFQAEYGSAMDCSNASASGCYIAGIASLSNSNVRAISATSSSNTGSGFLARDNGTIENHSSTANNNTRYGEERLGGGVIHGNSVTLSGNTIAAYNGYSYFDNSQANGARISANGPLRIDNNGTDPTYFNTSGGVQAEIFHTASSNSWVQLTGSSGNAPRVQAGGSASNIDLQLLPKGTGQLRWGVHSAGSVTTNGYVEWKLADGATVRVAAQRI